MNAPVDHRQIESDSLSAAREEAHALLATVRHYCLCAMMHLEVADDSVTLMDIMCAREYFIAAIRAFSPVRDAMKIRAPSSEREAA